MDCLGFCFFFACGKKTYSQCEKTKNLELVLFSLFTSDTRYMCVKNSSKYNVVLSMVSFVWICFSTPLCRKRDDKQITTIYTV